MSFQVEESHSHLNEPVEVPSSEADPKPSTAAAAEPPAVGSLLVDYDSDVSWSEEINEEKVPKVSKLTTTITQNAYPLGNKEGLSSVKVTSVAIQLNVDVRQGGSSR